MRVLYVALRYHTNQVPVMRGWIHNGEDVMFVSQSVALIEDHRDLEPVVLGYSKLYRALLGIYCKIKHLDDLDALGDINARVGIPPFGQIKKVIKDFNPDVVIVRERSLYSIAAFNACKKLGIPCILYNQSPVWEKERGKKSFVWHWVRNHAPQYRMTVAEGQPGPGMIRDPHTYYVPFVMEPHVYEEPRVYCRDGEVHMLVVGRFVDWKNHGITLESFANLAEKYPIKLTIVGECITDIQKDYYNWVVSFLKEHNIEDKVTLIKNATRDQVFEEYAKADIFLLPCQDSVTVSQLEAMSFALPIICTDLPGKRDYVDEGQNGYLVELDNQKDLQDKMERMIQEKDRLADMGQKSLEMVMKMNSFELYRNNILKIMDDMKKGI